MSKRKTWSSVAVLWLAIWVLTGCAFPREEGKSSTAPDPPPSVLAFSFKTRLYCEDGQITLYGKLRGPAPLPDRLDVWIRSADREAVEDVAVSVSRRMPDDGVQEGAFSARIPPFGSQRLTIRIVPHGDPKPSD